MSSDEGESIDLIPPVSQSLWNRAVSSDTSKEIAQSLISESQSLWNRAVSSDVKMIRNFEGQAESQSLWNRAVSSDRNS